MGSCVAILSLIKEEDKPTLANRIVEKSMSVREAEAAAKALEVIRTEGALKAYALALGKE